jgi:uncharacterized membrane protein YgcG
VRAGDTSGQVVPVTGTDGSAHRDITDPFRPVHGTGPLSPHDIDRIDRMARHAERNTGLHFAIYVGPADEADPWAYAVRLHSALDDADHAVLILVDPTARVLEIVTGAATRRLLGDAECRLAAATMQSNFVAHDLAGGLTAGIQQLANAAYEAPTLHLADQNS